MRRRVTVRPKALDDMEEIYFYGLAHFGLQVAEDYLRRIRLSITLATTNSAKHRCNRPRPMGIARRQPPDLFSTAQAGGEYQSAASFPRSAQPILFS